MTGHDGRADGRGREGGEYEQGDGGGKEVCGVGDAHSAKKRQCVKWRDDTVSDRREEGK